MDWRIIALVIAAGAACGGSQRAPMDTARIEENADAMHRALKREEERRGAVQPQAPLVSHSARDVTAAPPQPYDDAPFQQYIADLYATGNALNIALASSAKILVTIALRERESCGATVTGRIIFTFASEGREVNDDARYVRETISGALVAHPIFKESDRRFEKHLIEQCERELSDHSRQRREKCAAFEGVDAIGIPVINQAEGSHYVGAKLICIDTGATLGMGFGHVSEASSPNRTSLAAQRDALVKRYAAIMRDSYPHRPSIQEQRQCRNDPLSEVHEFINGLCDDISPRICGTAAQRERLITLICTGTPEAHAEALLILEVGQKFP